MNHWAASILISMRNFHRDTQYFVREIRVHPLVLMELRRQHEPDMICMTEDGFKFCGVKAVEDQAVADFDVRRDEESMARMRRFAREIRL